MEFEDPLLLTAKMHMADFGSWARNYEYPHYVCTHFSKAFFDFMTVREIRCGYVIITFKTGQKHAIVAFDTDYGLKYFEPQSKQEMGRLEIGERYPMRLQGVPSDTEVSHIDISWNSDMQIRFYECENWECNYVLPVCYNEQIDKCPICGRLYAKEQNKIGHIQAGNKKEARMADTAQGKYTHEISRKYPACLIFLIDQSESMDDLFYDSDSSKKKAAGAADVLNRTINDLIIRCTRGSDKNKPIRDYYYIGVIGYGEKVGSAFSGELAGRDLVAISDLANNKREEKRERLIEDGTGGIVKETVPFVTWFDPVAKNSTPMCGALNLTYDILDKWIKEHPECYPPAVINITDGEANDGNPLEISQKIMNLSTEDGNVLLFNCNLSSNNKPKVYYPKTEAEVGFDKYASMLFNMSSLLPPPIIEAAKEENILSIDNGSRGFVFNADMVTFIKLVNLGSRKSINLR